MNNYYFTTLHEEFPLQAGEDHKKEPRDVPGFYLKLDPRNNHPKFGNKGLEWWTAEQYDNHPGMGGYNFIPPFKSGIRRILEENDIEFDENQIAWSILRTGRFFPEIMMVKVEPGKLICIDDRPPYASGRLPSGVQGYNHVNYITTGLTIPIDPLGKGLPNQTVDIASYAFRTLTGMEETFQSISYDKVLSIGVANSHRHTHYEDIYGVEMASGPNHIINGQILDRGGSWDGTCNFYILCRLSDREPGLGPSYGILWLDEQSYFSERWRLLSPRDHLWGPYRSWSMQAALHKGYDLENLRFLKDGDIDLQFWCPFDNYNVDDNCRMSVSRYVIAINGFTKEAGPEKKHEIFTIAFNWGGRDRTWRWRNIPEKANGDDSTNQLPDINPGDQMPENLVLMRTICIRADMTLHLKGRKTFKNDDDSRTTLSGRWFQKYLPADNWEVPHKNDLRENNGEKPIEGYSHPWRFISEPAFELSEQYFYFGNFEKYKDCTGPYITEGGIPLKDEGPVSNRSQFYPVSIVSMENGMPEDLEISAWLDKNDRLYTLVPNLQPLNTISKAIEEQDLSILNFDKMKELVCQCPPSIMNKGRTLLKIVNRGSLGWIAMWYDKRDDDLLPLIIDKNGTEVELTLDIKDRSTTDMKIRLYGQKRKWCPPVVQEVSIIPDTSSESFYITYKSLIKRKPRSTQRTFLDEFHFFSYLSDEQQVVLENLIWEHGNDPYEYYHTQKQNSQRSKFKNTLYDITIWKVKIFIIKAGDALKIFEGFIDYDRDYDTDLTVSDLPVFYFRRDDACTFSVQWGPGQYLRSLFSFEEIVNFFSDKGQAEFGTSVIFEDLTGHVAPPEKIVLR